MTLVETGSKFETSPSTVELNEEVISFPSGLVGCEQWKRFRLVLDPETEPFLRLESLDDEHVGFLVVDPFVFVPDYEFRISDGDTAELRLADASDARVLVILTIRENPLQVTANLLGPLVINLKKNLGKQLVLAESTYSVRHPVAVPESAAGASQ